MSTDVKQEPEKKKHWTVMLYMAAAEDERTEQAAIDDIKELEKVGTDDSKLNVLVQIDRRWPGYAERFRVEKGKSHPWGPPLKVRNIPEKKKNGSGNIYPIQAGNGRATNSGQSTVLRDFVVDARRMYQANHYLLVLWGHAYGLGFGRDHGDPLTLKEIKRSLDLRAFPRNVRIPKGRKPVDILGANACAMSYLEAAYELRHAADFMVAPQIAMPFIGWPYERILNEIVQKPDIDPEALGKRIVEEFVKSFRRQGVSLTLLDLGKARDAKKPLTELASALKSSRSNRKTSEQIAEAFLDTSHGDVRPLIDLYDLCTRLIEDVPHPEIQAKANEMRQFLEPAEKPRNAGDEEVQGATEATPSTSAPRNSRLVVMHDGDPNLEELHGVGIYAPSLTGEITLTRLELKDDEYRDLELSKKNKWVDFVYTDLSALLKSMNDQVLEFVKATGATQVVDRTGVAQLMLSVDRSFIKLEAMVAKTQTSVMSALDGRAASKNQHSVSPEELAIAAVRLSRPYLRLGTDLAQTNYGGRLGVPVSLGDLISPQAVESIARSLEELENVAANVERTTRKVLTHSTLGLGDGVNVRMGKPQMGKPQMGKPQMGKPQMGKPQMGKPQMGALARLTATESDSLSQPDGVSAIELFGQAAAALKLLEEAIAEIERDVRLFLTNPPLGRNGDGADYKRRSIEQVELSFRALNEVVANAKDTVFRIVADPSQGLGPTPEQSSVGFDRQNLALAGGLSALDLTLL